MESLKVDELEQLRAENAQLKRDQDFMFLVVDIGLKVMEEWARQNNLLLPSGKNSKPNFTNENNLVGIFFKQIRKAEQDELFNRIVELLDRLGNEK